MKNLVRQPRTAAPPPQNDAALALRYSALPQFASPAREALRIFGARFLGEDDLFDFVTATGEAIANGIEHGSQKPGAVLMIVVHDDLSGELIVQITSEGRWRVFTPRDERGRGVPIMRACSRHLDISSTNEYTTVRLTFRYR